MMFARALFASTMLLGTVVAAQAEQITGAGSSFAAPIYNKWAEAAGSTGITLNYQSVGSGAGQKLVFARTVDFGASDAPVSADKLAMHKLIQFPTVMGAVDVIVNLPGIKPDAIKLTGPIVATIYLGIVTKWNDPAIAAINPGVKLPDLAIAPVYRADGSGTTFVFTSYLSKVDPQFKDKVGAATAVSWPVGNGAKGTDGVSATVKNTAGGIGYAESAYATLNHLTTVQMQNHEGKFVHPTLASFAAAASNGDWANAKNFAVDLTDTAGAASWPIVSPTYVLLPTDADAAKTAAVTKFFGWALKSGDATAKGLQYVALPPKVKAAVMASWTAMPGK